MEKVEKQGLTLVKIGGKVIDDPQALGEFLDAFCAIPGIKLLVHGGGTLATKQAQQMGIKTKMVDGRRITDRESLRVVTGVYAGLVNKNIVASLQARNIQSLGICGADLNLINAARRVHPSIDYGFVGDVTEVNAQAIEGLLNQGTCVVVAPLTHDGNGQLLNTNADTIATELAIALSKIYDVKLVYSFEKPGVLLDPDAGTTIVEEMDKETYELLKDSGTIAQGMLPKTHNAFHAFDSGVSEVVIGNLVAQQTQGIMGTRIVEQVDAN